MGFKCKLTVGIASAVVVFAVLIGMGWTMLKGESEDYQAKLLSVFKEQETATAQDIFSFDFERAYLFNDPYLSGEGFAERYQLELSIGEVGPGVSENIQRIVFVDESGAFVYEFRCDSNKVVLLEGGMVITPQTVIEKVSAPEDAVTTLQFQSQERYDG